MKKVVLFLVLGILSAIPLMMTAQVKQAEPPNILKRVIDANGNEMVMVGINGKPPAFRMPEADAPSTAVLLSNVPAFDWSFGCSATSAAMMAAYYDRTGYYFMYTGQTQGGLMPMDNSSWGTVVINGETRNQCPLSATRNGVDGRTSRGHVDDYWIQYGSIANDPYITNGWTQHTWGSCTGDYMGTNQSYYGNSDGNTNFWYYTNGAAMCDYSGAANEKDGCAGMRDFFESRGYTVTQNCSQYIYGYNGNSQGFTFTQYKAEIDAGRPVLIQVDNHTMLGFGYDNTGNQVYLHDTWDYGTHTMTWGGSYGGLNHYGVTTIHLQAYTYNPCVSSISLGNSGAANAETFWGGGVGVWYNSVTNPCGYTTPGIEQVYTFVAPVSGYYSIQVTTASGYVDYLWKASSCSTTGWNCIGRISTPGTYGSMYFTSGATYYILLDDENSTEGQHTFFVFLNPCNNITTIGGTGSGYSQTYPGGGYGGWYTYSASPCEFNCPGREKVYSFVPSTTGLYSIAVTAAASWVDYMWKSSSCASTGWSCIDDIFSPGTYGSMSMTAGTTYYILLDDENTSAGAHTFYITLAEAAGTWEGTVSSDWSNPANWSAATVPTSAINVVIPGGRPHQPTIGGSLTANAKNLTIQSGAILTQAGTTPNYLYIFGNMNSDAGQFTMTGSSFLYFDGPSYAYWDDDNENDTYTNVRVNKDVSTAELSMWQNMTCSGTFEVREGVFSIDGTWTLTITNTSAYAFEVEDGGKLVLTDETIDCAGDVIFQDGSQATLNGGVIICGGDFNVSANASYDIIFNGGILKMDGAGTTYINDLDGGNLQLYTLIINNPGGVCYLKSANLDINNQLNIAGGMLSCKNGPAPTATYNIYMAGNWFNQVGPSAFEESTGTVIFNGGNYHQYCYDESFYTLEVNKPLGGAFRISNHDVTCSHYNWTAGAVDVLSGSFTANDLVDNGLYGSFYVNPGGTINLYNTDSWVDLHGFLYIFGGNFNIYGGSGIDSYWPYVADGGVTMSGGVLDFKNVGVYLYPSAYTFTENITGGTIRTSRGFRVDRADFTPEGGTIEFYGPTDGTLHTTAGNVVNVLFNKSSSDNLTVDVPFIQNREDGSITDAPMTNTVNIDNTTDVNGSFTIQAGIVNAGANTLYIGGDWDNQIGSAAFNEGTSTVWFDGATDGNILSDETFNNLYVNKSGIDFDELDLMSGLDLNVLENLYIYDGSFELNGMNEIHVTNNLGMVNGAGLNANDLAAIDIYVGNQWINNNADYNTTHGFDPGTYSTVIFNGTVDQLLTSSATEETFNNLRVDKTTGKFRTNDNIKCQGDMEVTSGTWEDNVADLHHIFWGDFTVQSSGVFSTTSMQNTVEFSGAGNSVLTYLSTSGYFYHMFINKETGYGVTQATNTSCQNDGNLTLDNGFFSLNGKSLVITGNVAVNDASILSLPASSTLTMTNSNLINVNAGGRLDVAGTLTQPATIRANVSTARYTFNINPGGTLAADYGIFKNMGVNGIFVSSGSTIDPAHALYGCTFQDGTAGGPLLSINNSQTLTIRNAVFPTNTWSGASNVSKTLNSGRIYFVDFSGDFSGEAYDADAFNRIDWIPTLTATATATSNPICAGSSTQMNVTVTGGLPSYTYLWSPTTGLSNPNIINPVATPAGSTRYSVTVTDALGSTQTSGITVTVNPILPAGVSIVASANPSPPGNWVTFTATPVNGGTSPSYQWKKNGLNVGSGTAVYSTNTLAYNDQISCVMTSNYQCPSGNPANSNTITMIIVADNSTVYGTIPYGTSVCIDATNTITVGGPSGPFLIQNGGRVKMIAGVKISYLYGTTVQSGGYLWGYITNTNAYCGSVPPPMVAVAASGASAGEVAVSGASAAEKVGEPVEPTFVLYPNPTTGSFTLQSNDPGFRGKVKVEVLSMRGERILTAGYEGARSHHFLLEGLPSGLYFVKVMAEGEVEPFKLVVTR